MASSSRNTGETSAAAAARGRDLSEPEYFDELEFGIYPYNKIVRRLRENNINSSKVKFGYVKRLFIQPSPEEVGTEELEVRIFNIVQNNIIISNNDLVSRLNIIEYDEKNPQEKYKHNFYIRSWKLSKEAIDRIMNEFLIEDTYSSVMESWFIQISAKKDALYYYIRYVGFCVLSNPKERFESDLKDRKNGFMSSFFKKIEDLPANLKPETFIHVLKKDAVTLTWPLNESADLQEQILINLFGVDQLLNSQPGGFNAKYTPSVENFREYLDMVNPGFFKKFKSNSAPSKNNVNHQTIKDKLKKWINTVIRFQEGFDRVLSQQSNPQFNKSKFKIRDSYAATMYRMAKPTGYINGNVVLAMVGHDITVANFFNAKSILDSESSRAGYVLCDMISRLEAWENHSHNNYIVSDASKFIGKIPFIDLIPWLESPKLTIKYGLKQLSVYLNIVQPFITITFSRKVTSAAMANFAHENGLDNTINLTDVVGVPSIVSYNTDYLENREDTDGPPEGFSTMCIPHFHPGVDKYTTRLANGARDIIDIVWRVTLCIAEIAIDTINANKSLPREQLVQLIFRDCRKDSNTISGSLRYLYTQLDETKVRYKNSEKEARSEYREYNYVPEVLSQIKQANAVTRVSNSIKAEGIPRSAQRYNQVLKLWKMNYPYLHNLYSRNQKQEWFNWTLSVPENVPYYLSAMGKAGHVSQLGKPSPHLRSIINTYRPKDISYEDVLRSEDLTKKCYIAWSQHLSSFRKPGSKNYSSEVQRARGQKAQKVLKEKKGFLYSEQVHRWDVYLTTRGYALLYWVDSGKNKVDIKIDIPYAIQETAARTLVIKKDGIDLIARSPGMPVISVSTISLKGDGSAKLGLDIAVIPDPAIVIERGQPLPKLNAPLNTIIEEGDEVYLLKRYLEKVDFIKKTLITSIVNQDHHDAYLEKKKMEADSVEFFFIEFKKYIDDNHRDHPYYHQMNARLEKCETIQSNLRGHIFRLLQDLANNHIDGLSSDTKTTYSFRPIKKKPNTVVSCIELTVKKSHLV